MKARQSLFGAFCALLLAAGCAVQGAPRPSPTATPEATHRPTPSPAAETLSPEARTLAVPPADELLFEGKLLICSDLPYPPQEFFDDAGEPTGSDIELGQELARRLGLEAEIVNSLFDTIIDAVNGGKCDIVISAQNITAEREAQVAMIPYFQAGMAFVVGRGNPAGIRTELDLCGRRIAAQRGTVQVQVVTSSGEYGGSGLAQLCTQHSKRPPSLSEYEKDDEALAALKSGAVQAYFVDSPAAGYHVLQAPEALQLAGLTLEVAVQGISVPHSRPGLRRAVDAALHSMMDDGTYLAILARYGVQDGSVAAMTSR